MFGRRKKETRWQVPKVVANMYEAERRSRERLSRWLSRRAHRMGRARVTGFCIGLLVCGAGFFGWTIVENLGAAGWTLKLPAVVAPKVLDVVQDRKHVKTPKDFGRRFDSFMLHPPVFRLRMDSVFKARPGLADTVNWLRENR